MSTGATGTRAEIQLAGSGGFKTLSLANPNRLVVDFPDSSGVRGLKLPTAAGLVTSVRTGQPVPGTFRVVFELATPVTPLKPQMQTIGSGSTLVIEWPGDPPRLLPPRLPRLQRRLRPHAASAQCTNRAARNCRTGRFCAAARLLSATTQPQTPSPAPYVPASAMPTITQAPVPTTVATGIPTPRPTTDNAAPTGVAGSVPNLATAPTGNALAGAVAAGSSAAAAAILNGDSAPMGLRRQE